MEKPHNGSETSKYKFPVKACPTTRSIETNIPGKQLDINIYKTLTCNYKMMLLLITDAEILKNVRKD